MDNEKQPEPEAKPEPKAETVTAVPKEKKPHNHLNYVAWAFMFIGAMALIETVQQFINQPAPVPDFLLIFIVVGWGLLKRKAYWRTFALSCAYVFVIFSLGNLAMIFSGVKSLDSLNTLEQVFFWVRTVAMIAAGVYAVWALQTKSVRDQFKSKL